MDFELEVPGDCGTVRVAAERVQFGKALLEIQDVVDELGKVVVVNEVDLERKTNIVS